jgi:signal transduction histidine kinase
VRAAGPAVRVAWRGLAQVLAAPDPPAGGRRRSFWRRRAGLVALGAATPLLCVASVASLGDGHGLSGVAIKTPMRSGAPAHPGTKTPRPPTWSFFRGSPLPSRGSPAAVATPHSPLMAIPGGPVTLSVLVALVVVVPLALAARYPLLGWRIGWLALLLVPLLNLRWWGGLPWGPAQIAVLLVVLWMAGIRHDRPVLGWLWALTLLPWWFWVSKDGPGLVTAALGCLAFLAMALAVDGTGAARRAQLALAGQAERAEQERAQRAVLEERTRIARELHDVVAHHMSLLAVRAESAPNRLGARLGGLPDPVRAEFGSLSGSAREALADMRRLLGVLRSDQPAARAPQPGLPDLPGLIGTARQAGMAVELSAPSVLDQVPSSASVCAYRIVQEALSNAARHAEGAPVTVSVRHDTTTVTLQVTNGPGGTAGPHTNGHGGHGLVGMRERVELLGGSLSAGHAPGGGFAVSAVLPLNGPAA